LQDIRQILWSRLKIIASIVGDTQARIIATIFYFTILVPFAVISRLASDPLHTRSTPNTSYWVQRVPVQNDLDEAKRQG
jgi:hypothetical protein